MKRITMVLALASALLVAAAPSASAGHQPLADMTKRVRTLEAAINAYDYCPTASCQLTMMGRIDIAAIWINADAKILTMMNHTQPCHRQFTVIRNGSAVIEQDAHLAVETYLSPLSVHATAIAVGTLEPVLEDVVSFCTLTGRLHSPRPIF